jgi:hypothetical protein
LPAALRLFGGPRPAPPRPLTTPLDATILARFELFRRPALPGDAPPARGLAGGTLARELTQDYTLASYYPAYLRELTVRSGGRRYYVVPAFGRREALPPAGCVSAGARRELAAQQRRRSVEPVVCIVEAGGQVDQPVGCEPFAAIDQYTEIFQSGDSSGDPIISLVPDGVASVRISYRVRAPIVVPVSDNAILFTPPPPSHRLTADQDLLSRLQVGEYCYRTSPHAHWQCRSTRRTTAERTQYTKTLADYRQVVAASDPTTVEWLDASGGVIRTITPRLPTASPPPRSVTFAHPSRDDREGGPSAHPATGGPGASWSLAPAGCEGAGASRTSCKPAPHPRHDAT